MSLPILQPNSTPNLPQIRGEVTIDSSVIVASGVILNATPGNKIIIHAGVCLGMGTIITAHEGDIEIQSNAILGPGTLILGNCVIGSQASLGTSVTVYHANVESLAVIPAGSIIGDYSRQVDIGKEKAVVLDKSQEIPPGTEYQDQYSESNIIDKINQLNKNKHLSKKNLSSEKSTEDNSLQDAVDKLGNRQELISPDQKENLNNSNKPSVVKEKEKQIEENNNRLKSNVEKAKSDRQESSEAENSEKSSSSSQGIVKQKEVVGKVYINRLLYTLFPEKNYLNK